jgi:hypothetical protein
VGYKSFDAIVLPQTQANFPQKGAFLAGNGGQK